MRAMRAFRMIVAALLNAFLHEGEKTHDDIVACYGLTVFFIPTMLAHQFTRSEREGDWLL